MPNVRRDRRWRGSLVATTKRLAETIDLQQILPRIVQDAVELLDADSGDIMLIEGSKQALRVVAEYRVPGAMVGFELPSGLGLSWQAMTTGRPIAVGRYSSYEHRAGPLIDWPYETAVSAPLLSRGEAIGVLSVYAVEADHVRRDDLQLIQAFADHAAVALENARRHENETRLAGELAAANTELVRSLTLQKRLAEQVIAGKGLQGIADELARLLAEPVAIVDQFGRTLAGAPASTPDAWRPLTLPAPSTAPDRSNADAGSRQLTPVAWGHETRAFLITALTPPERALDAALVEIATTGIALELVRVEAATEVERRVRGEVLVDLLEGRLVAADEIERRTLPLGFDLSQPHHVLLMEPTLLQAPDATVDLRLVVDTIHDSIAHRNASSAAVAHRNRVAVFLPSEAQAPTTDSLLRLIRWLEQVVSTRVGDVELAVVDAGTFTNVTHYDRGVALAHQVLTASRRLGMSAKLVRASDLGVLQVLFESSDILQLVDFARKAVGPLLDYDRRHHGQLFDTLAAYVDEGGNQTAVARRLFLHPNSVAYRIRRIEDLLGGAIRSRELDLALAIRVLRVFAPAS